MAQALAGCWKGKVEMSLGPFRKKLKWGSAMTHEEMDNQENMTWRDVMGAEGMTSIRQHLGLSLCMYMASYTAPTPELLEGQDSLHV